jgi:hypothetical protein
MFYRYVTHCINNSHSFSWIAINSRLYLENFLVLFSSLSLHRWVNSSFKRLDFDITGWGPPVARRYNSQMWLSTCTY